MNMIGKAPDTISFAPCIARDRGQISVKSWTHFAAEECLPFLRAENEVDYDQAQRLWHMDQEKI